MVFQAFRVPTLSWSDLGSIWSPCLSRSRLGRVLGPSWRGLAASWGGLRACWSALGIPNDPPRPPRGSSKNLGFPWFFKVFVFIRLLGMILALYAFLARLGTVLDASWGHLGAAWPHLGAPGGRLGAVLEPSWGSQKPSKIGPKIDRKTIENRSHLGAPWGAKKPQKPIEKHHFINLVLTREREAREMTLRASP